MVQPRVAHHIAMTGVKPYLHPPPPPTGMEDRGRKPPNVVANGAKTNKMVQLFCNTLIFM